MFLYLIKHYMRSISRRKLFSFINITGLAFGIAFMILIGQFIYYEFNYNRSIKNIDNIYRLVDADAGNYDVDYRIKELTLNDVPGVKNICVFNRFGTEVNSGNNVFQIKDMLIVDPNFFMIFNTSFIHGNAKDALNSVDAVVLTESTAKNIFGTINAIGKTLQINHQYDMMVTGVVKDLPGNITFGAQLFVSVLNTPEHRLAYRMNCETYDGKDDSQCQYPYNVFFELEKNADKRIIEKQISAFGKTNTYRYSDNVLLTPLKTDYFNSDYRDWDLMHGNIELIKILSVIGIIILLLAVINFVNLATAAYRYRMTEIGIKKCFGVNRLSLIKQLLTESLFTCFFSSLSGVILAEIFLPYFNQFVDKSLTIQIYSDPVFFVLFISFVLFLSILTGLIPAVVLSRITPLQIFKINPYLKGTGKHYRGIFTVFQFSITTILIVSLIVITQQIDFVKHRNLGFSTDQLIYLSIHPTLAERSQIVSEKLKQFHGTKSLTNTNGIPGNINMRCDGHETICIDTVSLETFGFKIIKGRNLLPGDINKACLINYSSFKRFQDGDYRNHKVNGSEIVGVVSDFHYSSLHNQTGPLVLLYNNWGTNYITMRVSASIGETVDYIQKTWEEICPDYPINFGFYNEHFASMYKKEENLAAIVTIFSILAIIISCMGIFGLSVFQSEMKIKEIGVRKVLGATASEITYILTKKFSSWVLIANIIALPVSYYIMNSWLQDFAYRIDISWWMFVLSGGIALIIALATVSFQAIKAATANPIDSLKYE